MKRAFLVLGYVILGLLTLMVVGPLIVPIPSAPGTVPAQDLAYPTSQFITVGGLEIHYEEAGSGEPVYLLLHGFGASTWSWRELMSPLAERGRVIAYDRPAFGLTERPMRWTGENPYGTASQVGLAIALMDALGVERAVWIANSAGAAIAAQAALDHPGRVSELVLIAPALGPSRERQVTWRERIFRSPQIRRIGPLLVRNIAKTGNDTILRAWHDPSLVTDEIIANYRRPLRAHDWDRALWHFTNAPRTAALYEQLPSLTMPVILITGDDDRIVPTRATLRMAEYLSTARLVVLERCGHVPQEECPAALLEVIP